MSLEQGACTLSLEQGAWTFVYKRPDSKYLWLNRDHEPCDLCSNLPTLAIATWNNMQLMGLAVFHQNLFKQQIVGWIWSVGCALPTCGLEFHTQRSWGIVCRCVGPLLGSPSCRCASWLTQGHIAGKQGWDPGPGLLTPVLCKFSLPREMPPPAVLLTCLLHWQSQTVGTQKGKWIN